MFNLGKVSEETKGLRNKDIPDGGEFPNDTKPLV
jgi:hypothetical protein